MIILFLAYSLAQSTFGDAGPIPSSIEQRDISTDDIQTNGRSLYSIIWSCLSTIFLCTWVAIHPNIVVKSDRRDTEWSKTWIWNPLQEFLSYKLPLFFCALLVPEYILAWAVRQYVTAGALQKKVPGWTRTHGFFMIMGGFHLFQLPDGAASIPLPVDSSSRFVIPSGEHSREDEIALHPLQMSAVPTGVLKFISPTEKELKDKGKSDGLTKFIVLIQAAWFVVQCIARGVQQLPLTELEIVTLAYTMVNFFIYVFWWDKPRNVGCPVRVYKAPTVSQEKDEGAEEWDDFWLTRMLQKILGYIMGWQDSHVNLINRTSVPIFWSGRMKDTGLGYATLGPSILGAAFGAIHCIAWWSSFPSYTEFVIWRISCIAMICVPLTATIYASGMILGDRVDNGRLSFLLWPILMATVILLGAFGWLYVVARVATLVIALTTLRSLPSAAFSVVDWTVFIPHI